MAHVELREGDKKLGARDVLLASGINRIAFETSIKSESGPVTVEAEVSAPGETFLNNNKFDTPIVINGAPRVLYRRTYTEREVPTMALQMKV